MEALGRQAPRSPSPQLITQSQGHKVLVGVQEGSGHIWASFLEEVTFDCTCRGQYIFVAQVPKSLGVLPFIQRTGAPSASWSPSCLISGSPPLPREAELWQLWGKLRQEEPQLAGNLEGFLAKMTSRLQEARADKEVLELTLRK